MTIPLYRCHKEVRAVKIKAIGYAGAGGGVITPEEEGLEPFCVSQDYMTRHSPRVGGYYIVHEDGHVDFSPASDFEAGYTLVT